MDVHKYNVGLCMARKPFDGFLNAVDCRNYFKTTQFIQDGFQVPDGQLLVFYNDCFHSISGLSNGMITENSLFAFLIVIILFASK